MKVLMINSVCGIRSTGRICTDIAKILSEEGHECKIAYGREHVPEQYNDIAYRIGSNIDVRLHALLSRVMDNAGFCSRKMTEKFIRWIEEYDPDIIHLHNIHGYYINIEILLNYLKKTGKPVVYTLHDCWSFTGHCSHFEYVGCQKWLKQCENCPQKAEYPKSIFMDHSKKNYIWKKKLFSQIENMTIVTPSNWLANLTNQSFHSAHNIKVIHNGIDLKSFKPMKTDFKEKSGIGDKKVILGVASAWNDKKGLTDFLKLSGLIDEEHVIVLVGVSEKQMKAFPKNVIGISNTDSVKELVEIYSVADVFVNLTYEDNYPTVNLEAYACGIPVITYRTGGSVESAAEELIVEQGDVEQVWNLIAHKRYDVNFEIDVDKNTCLRQYYDLYLELISRK